MSSAKPFKVNVPDEELQRLQERLKAAIYPDQLKNISAWEDGTDLPYFKVSPLTDTWSAVRTEQIQRRWAAAFS